MGHGHAHGAGAADAGAGTERRLGITLAVMLVVMVGEAAGGWASGSLALVADAAHMATDAISVGLALLAIRFAKRPADTRRSYGYRRAEILAALVNGLGLFAITGWIVYEAIRRITAPTEIETTTMLLVGIVATLANGGAALILQRGDSANLNVKGALIHVISDLLGAIGAVVAALVIMATGWSAADPILSIFVAVLVLGSAWRVTRGAAHILLEGAPPGFDAEAVAARIRDAVPAVVDVHHVHAWLITQERPMITLHAVVDPSADRQTTLAAINAVLGRDFGMSHTTIQVEDPGVTH